MTKVSELNMVIIIRLEFSSLFGLGLIWKSKEHLNHFEGLIPIVKVKYLTPEETWNESLEYIILLNIYIHTP